MRQLYHFAFFDEASKREIRRAVLKGIAIPGHQIPFASRESLGAAKSFSV